MDITTEPVAAVTTLPNWSSTETATLGIELPAVPGPGAAGVNTKALAEPARMVTLDEGGDAVSPVLVAWKV